MKRFGIAAAAALAFSGAADAAPWRHEEYDDGHLAQQWTEDSRYLLTFSCGEEDNDGAFRILTSERYEPTRHDARTVPISFASNGQRLEIPGAFKEEDAHVSVYFGPTPKLAQLYDLITNAKGDIKVSFLDRRLSFSADGAATALGYATEGSPDSCHPYGM